MGVCPSKRNGHEPIMESRVIIYVQKNHTFLRGVWGLGMRLPMTQQHVYTSYHTIYEEAVIHYIYTIHIHTNDKWPILMHMALQLFRILFQNSPAVDTINMNTSEAVCHSVPQQRTA